MMIMIVIMMMMMMIIIMTVIFIHDSDENDCLQFVDDSIYENKC